MKQKKTKYAILKNKQGNILYLVKGRDFERQFIKATPKLFYDDGKICKLKGGYIYFDIQYMYDVIIKSHDLKELEQRFMLEIL